MIAHRPILVFALASGCLLARGAEAAPGVRFADVAARVIVIPEARSTVQVAIAPGDPRLPALHTRVEGDTVVVDGGLRGRIGSCGAINFDLMGALHHKPGVAQPGQRVMVRGIGPLALDHLPTITVHAPLRTAIAAQGAVFGAVRATQTLALDNAGCGDWRLGPVAGRLDLVMSGSGDVGGERTGGLAAALQGSGDVRLGDVDGPAEVSIRGSSDVKLGRVSGALQAHVAGSGDVVVARADGPVTASIRGSGDVRIADGRSPAVTVDVAGSGDFTFRGVAGALNASTAGSGDVHVSHVTGPVSKASAGSGEILIGDR